MDQISPETLQGREGQTFTFAGREARLVSATTTASSGLSSTIALFEAAEPHGLYQATCTVAHPDLADTELFVVASSQTELCVTLTSLTSR